MTIVLSIWWLPIILSVAFLVLMFRPYRRMGDYDFGQVDRLFWLIPVALVWVVFFFFLWVTK